MSDVLSEDAIVLRGAAQTRDEAITEAGQLLVAVGSVDPSYVDAMHAREQSVSTYMGSLLAIPHGTNEAKSAVRATGLSFVRYPDGVDWNGNEVRFVLGIASAGDEHLVLLGKIAEVFMDADRVAALEAAQTKADITAVLDGVSVS